MTAPQLAEKSEIRGKEMERRSLKDVARSYWQMGLAVVPIKLKWDAEKQKWNNKPLCDWSQWQTRPQTLEEFEAINWENIKAFSVLLGKTKDGYYFCCLDIDKEDFDLGLLRTTYFERTIGKGIHAFYRSRHPVEGMKRHDLGIELLGMHNLVVVYPSRGYKRLNDNEPTVVENAQTLFYDLIAKLGGELKPEAEKQIEAEAVDTWLLEKWLEQILKSGKLKIAGGNAKYYYVHCPFHLPDRNPSFAIHKLKFYGVDYHDGQVYSLKKLAERLGIELGGSKGEGFRLGAFKLEMKGKDVFLINQKNRPIYSCKLHLLNSDKVKKELSQLTDLGKKEIEEKIAAFLFQLENEDKSRDIKERKT